MSYRTVFDVAHSSLAPMPLVTAVGLLAVGALLVFAPGLMQRVLPYGLQGRARTIFSYVFFAFAILGAYVFGYGQYRNRAATIAYLNSGQAKVVEGIVTDFKPMPYNGHAVESFSVDGKHFSYSDYILTSGFNTTASHGGPIREGLKVRITYRGNLILRLEVAE